MRSIFYLLTDYRASTLRDGLLSLFIDREWRSLRDGTVCTVYTALVGHGTDVDVSRPHGYGFI